MTVERVRRNPRDRASMRRRAPTAPAQEARPVRTLAEDAPLVAVLVSGESGRPSPLDLQALAAGRRLAEPNGYGLLAVCCGPEPVEALGDLGVDRVGTLRGDTAEALSAGIGAARDRLALPHVLAADQGVPAEALRRLAALSGQGLRSNVRDLDGNGCVCLEDAERWERARNLAPFLLCAPGQFEADRAETRGEAKALDLPGGEPPAGAEVLDVTHIPARDLPLEDAPLILSAGAGIADWDLFHRLAERLGAAEGGSRVVCDAGRMPRDRQVGASGTQVSARCYVAVGISGAIQHLQGIEACRQVVAINSDPHAPIHGRATLSIVADAGEVMQALLGELEKQNG